MLKDDRTADVTADAAPGPSRLDKGKARARDSTPVPHGWEVAQPESGGNDGWIAAKKTFRPITLPPPKRPLEHVIDLDDEPVADEMPPPRAPVPEFPTPFWTKKPR